MRKFLLATSLILAATAAQAQNMPTYQPLQIPGYSYQPGAGGQLYNYVPAPRNNTAADIARQWNSAQPQPRMRTTCQFIGQFMFCN